MRAPPPPPSPLLMNCTTNRAALATTASSAIAAQDLRPGPESLRFAGDGVEHAGRLAGGRPRPRRLHLQRGREVVDHLADVLVALGGVLGGRPLDHQGRCRGDLGTALLDVGKLLVDVFHRHPDLAVGMEGDLADQHLVEDDAERVDVGALVRATAHRLLGGDVVGRPQHPPGRGHPVLLELAGDAEVGQLRPSLGVDQDVLRLDVAVDHLAGVGDGQPAGDLDRVGERLLSVERPDPGDPLLQRFPFHVLEDDVGVAAVLAGVDHRHHIGMGELRHRPRLLAEALQLVGLLGHLPVHDLDRDVAVERAVAGQVHGRHAPAADFGRQLVAAREHGADHLRAGRGRVHQARRRSTRGGPSAARPMRLAAG